MGGYLPLFLPVRLLQNILQLFLCNGRTANLAHAKHKEPLMIRSKFHNYIDLLAFSVSLRDDSVVSIFSWINVGLFLLMIRVTTYSTLPLVGAPLDIKTATVQLVICVVGWIVKAIPPSSISTGGIN